MHVPGGRGCACIRDNRYVAELDAFGRVRSCITPRDYVIKQEPFDG